MPWHPALDQLRDAIADLYPTEADARRMTTQAGLDTGRIEFSGKAISIWHSILEEAEKLGKVDPVIRAATAEHPANVPLLAAAVAYYQEVAMPQLSALMSTATPAADPLLLGLGHGVAMKLVRVPAGEFLMGSADGAADAKEDEKPQHTMRLPEYLIGKHPVTVAQYRLFVQATGYPEAASEAISGEHDDHPVVCVDWPAALAFCDWASDVSGQRVRLPSEAEWEKAARWDETTGHARIYPWGDRWDARRCNSREARLAGTTPVGRYSPLGDSPCGCADMAGNVWEWTRSVYAPYPYDPMDGRESIVAGDDLPRAVRGGSFYVDGRSVRCAVRAAYAPFTSWLITIGFRVVVVPASS